MTIPISYYVSAQTSCHPKEREREREGGGEKDAAVSAGAVGGRAEQREREREILERDGRGRTAGWAGSPDRKVSNALSAPEVLDTSEMDGGGHTGTIRVPKREQRRRLGLVLGGHRVLSQ